ncbi:MFS transporter [Planctomyces sp. SH-PL62]|uniref:MFS transporter n=1 Tax=Planctomyces sp. SH-PL62 TaxID=1636152 RepID=UPI00078C2C68|nr:MFS transporter [Planctomyces sp. SH-PL62]AMV39079.1 D-galactonate transporter [Planctomyces sp. SH-PL62]
MSAPSSDPDFPDTSPSLPRIAWMTVAMLAPVALLNYLDRQMLAAMKTSMMADIPDIASRENWGFMLGSFKWVYAVLSPIGGYIADRYSRRLVIVSSLFVWSAVTWVTGYVTTYDGLVATRALMGISEAFYIPAALALITDFHRGSTRSRAVGIHQTGIYAGLILGGFAGHVADAPDLGWRFAFQACGLVGVVYAIPLLLVLRDPPVRESEREHRGASMGSALGELARNRDFLLLVIYFTLPAMAGWVVKDWMPDILKERFGLTQGNAGVYAVLPVQIASLVGVVFGGWMADMGMRRSDRGRIFVSAVGMILFLPALFGVGLSEHLGLAVAFLILYGIGWGFFDCNNMPILSQIVPPDRRATGYGVMNLVSISCGGFADWGFGALRDRHMPLSVIFGVFALIALVSVAVVLAIRPKPELTANAQQKE